MADNDNSEELQLNTSQATKALKGVVDQAEALFAALKKSGNFKDEGLLKRLNDVQKSLKQTGTIIDAYGNSLSTMPQKFVAATNRINSQIEKTGNAIGIQARQLERAAKLVNDTLKTQGNSTALSVIKKNTAANAEYEAGLKRIQQLVAQTDRVGRNSNAGRPIVAQIKQEQEALAALIATRAKSILAEKENALQKAATGRAGVKAAREEAAAFAQAAREEQADVNRTYRIRMKVWRAEQAEKLRGLRAQAAEIKRQQRQMVTPTAGESVSQKLTRNVTTFANYALLGAAVGGAAATANEIVKLDEALHNLQGITQTSDAGMAKLRDQILQVSAASKFMASDIADAATILGQAGLSTAQIGESLNAVAVFAQATGIKLEESVNLITSAMGAFNLRANESMNIANLFTAALNNSKLTVDQLSQGFQYSANSAAQLGVNYSELATVMALLANSGIKSGSMIGTGIRQILTQLSNPSKKLKDVLLSLNVSLDDIDIKSHGLIGVMKNLHDAGFNAAEAFRAFGSRGAGAFIALEGQLDNADAMQKSIIGTQAAVKAAEIQMKSFTNTAKNTFAAVSAAAAKAFDPLLSALKLVVEGLGYVARAASQAGPAIEFLATALAIVAGVKAAAYIGGLLGIGNAINSIRNAFVAFRYIGITALFSGWGLAIAGVAAALVGLDYLLNKSAKDAAANAEALDAANATYKTAVQTYQNLGEETQNLLAKENDLRKNKGELAAQTAYLGERFQKLGLDVRGLTDDYDGLLAKMRALRGASLLEQQNALNGLKSAQTAVLGDQRDVLAQNVRAAQIQYNGAGNPAVDAFFKRTRAGSAPLGSNDTNTVLAAAVAASKAGNEPLRKALDNVFQQLKVVTTTEQGLNKIGVNQQAVGLMKGGRFQDFQNLTETTINDLTQVRSAAHPNGKPENGGEDAKDAIKYATDINAWYTNLVSKLSTLRNAVTSYRKGGAANATALDNSGVDKQLTDALANATIIRDSANAAAKAQRIQLAGNQKTRDQHALDVANDAMSHADNAEQAKQIYERIQGLTTAIFNADVDKKAAELGLREDQYKAGGGKINLVPGNYDKVTLDNVRTVNQDVDYAHQKNTQDYNNKISTFAKKTGRGVLSNDNRVTGADAKAAAASISNYLKDVTDAFTELDKYSPISVVREHLKAAQDALVKWFDAAKKQIEDDYQKQLKNLKPDTATDEDYKNLREARDNRLDELNTNYATRKDDVASKGADLLNNNVDRRAANFADAFEGIQSAAADPRKTKSSFSDIASTFQDVMIAAVDNVKSSFGNMWASFVDGSQSAGAAAKNFAKGLLQTMLQTVSNRIAQQFVSLIASFLPGSIGVGSASDFSTASSGIGGLAVGGVVKGKIPTRDSVVAALPKGAFVMRQSATRRLNFNSGGRVPVNVMPGERVFHPDEVAAIGLDNLKRFNGASSGSGNGLMSFASGGEIGANMGRAANQIGKRFDGALAMPKSKGSPATNVWVVHPDVQPQMTPNDVLVTVGQDILKNGQMKKLIKTVAAGG